RVRDAPSLNHLRSTLQHGPMTSHRRSSRGHFDASVALGDVITMPSGKAAKELVRLGAGDRLRAGTHLVEDCPSRPRKDAAADRQASRARPWLMPARAPRPSTWTTRHPSDTAGSAWGRPALPWPAPAFYRRSWRQAGSQPGTRLTRRRSPTVSRP